MKIDPKHDYKKPLYAIGTAALIGATAIFGSACTDPLAYGGEAQTESVLMGETTAATEIASSGEMIEGT